MVKINGTNSHDLCKYFSYDHQSIEKFLEDLYADDVASGRAE